MNEDMFTLNDERTIQEMLDDYDKLKEEVALLPSDVPKKNLQRNSHNFWTTTNKIVTF